MKIKHKYLHVYLYKHYGQTIKQVQSGLKIKGLTCQRIYDIFYEENMGSCIWNPSFPLSQQKLFYDYSRYKAYELFD